MDKDKVRVNVPNPQFPDNSTQERVVAVVDDSGQTAHTASGHTVPITDSTGNLLPEVVVPK